MKRPPLWMRMKIRNKDTKFGLWLPLFLLIPFVLVAFIVLLPLVLLVAVLFWWRGWHRPALLFIPRLWNVYCSMHGLEVSVQNQRETVYFCVK
jgi:hypothetical protein